MIPLRKPKVVHVVHHLCKEPVVGRVEWSIDQIGPNIGANGQRQELVGLVVNIEVCIDRRRIPRRRSQLLLITIIGVEETALLEELRQSLPRDRLGIAVRDLEVKRI